MPDTRIKYTKPKVLLVEGLMDKRFFSGLLGVLRIRSDFKIVVYKGENNLPEFLKGMINESDFRSNVISLGITRDANDAGVDRKTQSILATLHNAGLSQSPNEIIPTRSELNIAIHIMHDGSTTGRLEEMILKAIEKNWRMSCVNGYWDCLVNQFPDDDVLPKDKNKALLTMFLAATVRPDQAVRASFWNTENEEDELRLDYAIQKRYLNLDHSVYDELKEFLLTL